MSDTPEDERDEGDREHEAEPERAGDPERAHGPANGAEPGEETGADDPQQERDHADDDDTVDPDDAAPLSELAEDLEDRDVGASEEELFEQRSAPGIDREALWRQVADEETAERAIEEMDVEDGGPQVRRPDRGESVDTGERVVAKNSYCHTCRFFSPPPDVNCSHEGTEILEAVDMDHFRVRDCPIVEENEDLQEF